MKKWKKKKQCDIGQLVKIVYEEDIPKMINVLSKDTWLIHFPPLFLEMLNSNKKRTIEAINFAPNVYFELKPNFRKDKKVIKAAISSFKLHNRLNEVNTKTVPLTRKVER